MMEKLSYKDIENVNKTIRTINVKGKDYAEVNQRIKAFRMLMPNGTITTDIVSLENGVVLMKASVLDEDGKLLGTGYAQEKESSSFINKTSYIENCETSAVGRALGMLALGIDVSVASYEEVSNAIKNQGDKDITQTKNIAHTQPKSVTESFRDKLTNYIKADSENDEEFKRRMTEVASEFKLNGKSSDEDFKKVYEFLVEGK